MGGGEAKVDQALDARDSFQQADEIPVVIVVRVDVLAQEVDLPGPGADFGLHLGQDLGRRAAALPAAQVGDDAVGAEIVAASHDGHLGADAHPLRGAFQQAGQLSVQGDVHHPLPGRRPRNQVGQTGQGPGADDRVQVAEALQDPPALLLGQAAGQDDDEVGPGGLEPSQPAQEREGLLFGLGPHRAGVDDDQVGRLRLGRRLKAAPSQQPGQPLGVVHVHLTAECGQMELARSHRP